MNLSASNIRINGVGPGAVQTSLIANSAHAAAGEKFSLAMSEKDAKQSFQDVVDALGAGGQTQYYYNRIPQPDEIADVAIFLASDLSSAINGQLILADSGKSQGALGESYIGPVPAVKPMDLS